MASASDCITTPVPGKGREPIWGALNGAMHFPSVDVARQIARVEGVEAEIHATWLYPVVYLAAGNVRPISLSLRGLNGQDLVTEGQPPDAERLGFDIVSLNVSTSNLETGLVDWLKFDCAPLSCNTCGARLGVNRWCLLDSLSQAEAAALMFATEQPEPGPFVIVELWRVGPAVVNLQSTQRSRN